MLHLRHSTDDSATIERTEKCSDIVKGRKNKKILIQEEPCALIKHIDVLLERPKTKREKF